MKLVELLADVDGYEINGDPYTNISGIYYDSRQVKAGGLFVAIKGFKTDGHKFIPQAVENGAAAVVVEKADSVSRFPNIAVVKVMDGRAALAAIARAFYGYPDKKLRLIGVTGTNGKTSTTYMIKSILEQVGRRVGLIGTIQNMIGSQTIPTEHTTPESSDLQALFKQMADAGIDDVVMEVSSHSLELQRVAGCDFEIGVFTNLTRDHLDFHQTMENYFAAKQKLFQNAKFAAVNIDDEYGYRLADMLPPDKVCTFAIHRPADLMASHIRSDAKGSTFYISIEGRIQEIFINIPGMFSIYNALAAAAACHLVGISLETVQKGLKALKGVPGRFEVLNTDTDFTVIIDYAHTPDGLENILKAIKEVAKGKVIALFGCGGDRDTTKRPIMGEIGGRYADFCILTSDNPRSEDPMSIIRQIEEGIRRTDGRYIIIENRSEAIRYGLQIAQKDDILLLAGKGHETYQIFKDKTVHFDEREVVQKFLGEVNH